MVIIAVKTQTHAKVGVLALWILSFFFKSAESNDSYGGFERGNEAKYLGAFDEIIRASYSAPLPIELSTACAGKGKSGSFPEATLPPGTVSASQAQTVCGTNSKCVVPPSTTLNVDSNLNVGALLVKGELVWSQSSTSQWICAGYIVAEGNGKVTIDMRFASDSNSAFVYMKNNGAKHWSIGARVFGGFAEGSDDNPTIHVFGKEMARTWSLLASPVSEGSNSIRLIHDALAMGWGQGDRVIIAPTTPGSKGTADSRSIQSIQGSIVTLSSPTSQSFDADFFSGRGNAVARSAEVINLQRNIIITGDDFETINCNPAITGDSVAGCACTSYRSKCTIGLHTIMANGGEIKMKHSRIEKCGQRGIMGKYCLHFHLMGNASSSSFVGNAIEYSHQRGIIIHGSHLTTVKENVMSDVRGANIYIEDGNEMYNRIENNVAICPHKLNSNLGGCTIPGTDNADADTSVNQAGLWGLGFVS